MATSSDTWCCTGCNHEFGPNDSRHEVWYEEDEDGEITPLDVLGMPERVRELLRDLKRGVPRTKATVGPEHFCDSCYRQHFPNLRTQ